MQLTSIVNLISIMIHTKLIIVTLVIIVNMMIPPCINSFVLMPWKSYKNNYFMAMNMNSGESVEIEKQTFKELLERVKQNDAEWLKETLGDSLIEMLTEDTSEDMTTVLSDSNSNTLNTNDLTISATSDAHESNNNNLLSEKENLNQLNSLKAQNNQQFVNNVNNNNISDQSSYINQFNDNNNNTNNNNIKYNDNDSNNGNNENIIKLKEENEKLLQLGYSPLEITQLKDSVKIILLEKQVKRPKRGIPTEWINIPMMKKSSVMSSKSDITRKSGKNIGSTVGRIDKDNQSENEMLQSRKQRSTSLPPPIIDKDTKRVRSSRYDDLEGDSIKKSDMKKSDTINDNVAMKFNNKNKNNDNDEFNSDNDSNIYSDDVDSSVSLFWPDKNEFKELILEESRWRAKLGGEWLLPSIKQEAKWRYFLYKKWKDFLDRGVNYGFETVNMPNFEEEEDDEGGSYDDDEEDEYDDEGNDNDDDIKSSSNNGRYDINDDAIYPSSSGKSMNRKSLSAYDTNIRQSYIKNENEEFRWKNTPTNINIPDSDDDDDDGDDIDIDIDTTSSSNSNRKRVVPPRRDDSRPRSTMKQSDTMSEIREEDSRVRDRGRESRRSQESKQRIYEDDENDIEEYDDNEEEEDDDVSNRLLRDSIQDPRTPSRKKSLPDNRIPPSRSSPSSPVSRRTSASSSSSSSSTRESNRILERNRESERVPPRPPARRPPLDPLERKERQYQEWLERSILDEDGWTNISEEQRNIIISRREAIKQEKRNKKAEERRKLSDINANQWFDDVDRENNRNYDRSSRYETDDGDDEDDENDEEYFEEDNDDDDMEFNAMNVYQNRNTAQRRTTTSDRNKDMYRSERQPRRDISDDMPVGYTRTPNSAQRNPQRTPEGLSGNKRITSTKSRNTDNTLMNNINIYDSQKEEEDENELIESINEYMYKQERVDNYNSRNTRKSVPSLSLSPTNSNTVVNNDVATEVEVIISPVYSEDLFDNNVYPTTTTVSSVSDNIKAKANIRMNTGDDNNNIHVDVDDNNEDEIETEEMYQQRLLLEEEEAFRRAWEASAMRQPLYETYPSRTTRTSLQSNSPSSVNRKKRGDKDIDSYERNRSRRNN